MLITTKHNVGDIVYVVDSNPLDKETGSQVVGPLTVERLSACTIGDEAEIFVHYLLGDPPIAYLEQDVFTHRLLAVAEAEQRDKRDAAC